jgi:hypothetical protein
MLAGSLAYRNEYAAPPRSPVSLSMRGLFPFRQR